MPRGRGLAVDVSSPTRAVTASAAPSDSSLPLGIVEDGDAPKQAGHVRFVCISDTHGMHGKVRVPAGDVLVHCGDFTSTGEQGQVASLEAWLSSLPHEHKVVIAGNHDVTFHPEHYQANHQRYHRHPYDCEQVRRILTESASVTYLEDSAVTIHGLRVYGSPWQPEFCNWAFSLKRGAECQAVWAGIPDDTDILLTHGPPAGHGDTCWGGGAQVGCEHLMHRVRRVRPRYHIFGHVHEGYGVTHDGATTFVNASTCNLRYQPNNPPIVFDVPVPSTFAGELTADDAP